MKKNKKSKSEKIQDRLSFYKPKARKAPKKRTSGGTR